MKGVAKLEKGVGNVGLIDVPVPEVLAGHVLIEVKAAGVCGTDLHIYHDEYPSLPPVIMGHELAGVVAEIGKGVSRCKTGDRVTSETFFSVCGKCMYCRDGAPNLCASRKSIGSGVHGAFASYVLVPESNIHILPDTVDERSGAMTEPLACCVHALERTKVEAGQTVIVAGQGAIGLLMVQVAKASGAKVIVLGTDADESKLEVTRQLGASTVLNVQRDDVDKTVKELTNGYGADAIFECSGAPRSAQNCLTLVRRGGVFAQVGLFGRSVDWDLDTVCYKELTVTGSFATVPSSWRKALSLLEAGLVRTDLLVSHLFPVTDWNEAFNLFERGEGMKVMFVPD